MPSAQARLRGVLAPPPTRSPLLRSSPGAWPKRIPFFPPLPCFWGALGKHLGPPLGLSSPGVGREGPPPLLPALGGSFSRGEETCSLPFSFRGGESTAGCCCCSPSPPPCCTHTPHKHTPQQLSLPSSSRKKIYLNPTLQGVRMPWERKSTLQIARAPPKLLPLFLIPGVSTQVGVPFPAAAFSRSCYSLWGMSCLLGLYPRTLLWTDPPTPTHPSSGEG